MSTPTVYLEEEGVMLATIVANRVMSSVTARASSTKEINLRKAMISGKLLPGKWTALSGQSEQLEGCEHMAQHIFISTLAFGGAYKACTEVVGVILSLFFATGSPITIISGELWDRI